MNIIREFLNEQMDDKNSTPDSIENWNLPGNDKWEI